MTTQLLTQDIKTDDITVMSNVTSFTVMGTKISRVAPDTPQNQQVAEAIHIDFEVKHTDSQAIMAEPDVLGMILNLPDATQLGMLLVAMGLATKTPEERANALAELNQMIHNFG